MFDIVEARQLARNIKLFVIKAPRIAKKQRPGQFIILRLDESGERIPLTIADADPKAGTITICVQAIGKTTMLMNMLETGDTILQPLRISQHRSEQIAYAAESGQGVGNMELLRPKSGCDFAPG